MSIAMGILKVRVGVFNPKMLEKTVETEAVVDAGAIYSVVRRDILEALVVQPIKGLRLLEAMWSGM